MCFPVCRIQSRSWRESWGSKEPRKWTPLPPTYHLSHRGKLSSSPLDFTLWALYVHSVHCKSCLLWACLFVFSGFFLGWARGIFAPPWKWLCPPVKSLIKWEQYCQLCTPYISQITEFSPLKMILDFGILSLLHSDTEPAKYQESYSR